MMSRGQTLAALLAAKERQESRRSRVKVEPAPHPAFAVFDGCGRIAVVAAAVVFAWPKGAVNYTAQVWMGGLLALALACWILAAPFSRTRERYQLPLILLPVLLGLALVAFQLIAWSDAWATVIAPRQHELMREFASTSTASGAVAPATRITMDPFATRHDLALLFFGVAGVMLGGRFFNRDRSLRFLLFAVAGNGALLSLLGILQRTGIDDRIWVVESIYQATPYVSFVNRNNAAGFLLLCLSAAVGLVYWQFSQTRENARPHLIISREIPLWRRMQQRLGRFLNELTMPRLIALGLLVLNALGIVASLSRGGIIALCCGVLLTSVAFASVRRSGNSFGVIALAVAAVLSLTLWLGFGARLSDRFESLGGPQTINDTKRLQNWADTWPAVNDFRWFGSGLGSYHAVHRLYRSDLENAYFEYAENQYFQTWVELGWPGLVLLLAAVAIAVWMGVFVSEKGNSPRTIAVGASGMFLISSVGVASFFDYGLYLPANMMLMSILVGLTANHGHALAGRLKKKYGLRFQAPAAWTPVAVIMVTGGVVFSTYRIWEWSQIEAACPLEPSTQSYLALPLERTESQLQALRDGLRQWPTDWGHRRLAELYIHRYRLLQLEARMARLGLPAEELWPTTHLLDLREQMLGLQRNNAERLVRAIRGEPGFVENLIPAWNHLIMSRNEMPLEFTVHLMLAQLQLVIIGGDDSENLRRAESVAPSNADFRYIVGLMHLQAGRPEAAMRSWRQCIGLNSREYYGKIMRRILPRPNEPWRIPPAEVADNVFPDDPGLTYQFAHQYLRGDEFESLRQRLLHRADDLAIGKAAESDPDWVWLVARIKRDLRESAASLEKYEWLKQLQPNNTVARYEYARLLSDTEKYEAALRELQWLRSNDAENLARYSQLYDAVRRKIDKK